MSTFCYNFTGGLGRVAPQGWIGAIVERCRLGGDARLSGGDALLKDILIKFNIWIICIQLVAKSLYLNMLPPEIVA